MKNSLARRSRLTVETLEDRVVPSSLSVSDVTVREGATVMGILDQAGAAASASMVSVGSLSIPTRPTTTTATCSSPAGCSHSVARFDWATQTYQPFVAPGTGGLGDADEIAVGPDGNVYVGDRILRTSSSASTDRRCADARTRPDGRGLRQCWFQRGE